MAELILLILLLLLYFIPAIVGSNKSDSGSIFLFNLLAGWTLLGWLGALIWAISKEVQPTPAVAQQATPTSALAATPTRPVASEDVHPTQAAE
jgi:hypothetical protein